jgi:phosphoglycolate phosphatase
VPAAPENAVTVVFDLDGTLVDTAPDLVDTLNFVLTQQGLPPVPFDTARNLIGGGARQMLDRGLKAEGRSCTPDEMDGLYRQFLGHYSEHLADRSRPFPALEDALDALSADGAMFAVCTNKLEGLSRKLLGALGLLHRFAAVCGQDTFGLQKPDARFLRQTIHRAGGDAAWSIMVGDSGADIATARAVGIPVIAVDFGYTDVPVRELSPDRVISTFAALPAAVRALMPA